MKFELINKKDYKTTTWAHGETTQLYIFPQNGDYATRNFVWRISSATVTSDQSDFTQLFGIKRWILPFDGNLALSHTSNTKTLYSISLKPYEAHCFRGDWDTTSIGKVRDFNLMFKENAYSILKPFKLSGSKPETLEALFLDAFDERVPIIANQLTLGLYSRENAFEIISPNETVICEKENLLLLHYSLEEMRAVRKLILQQSNPEENNIVSFLVSY